MLNDIEARLRNLETEYKSMFSIMLSIQPMLTSVAQAIAMLGQLPLVPNSASLGTVSITVTLCGGVNDPGAPVSVSGPNGFTASGTADSTGVFQFQYNVVGSYTVTATPTDTTHYVATVDIYSLSSGNYNETIQCVTNSSWVCVPCCAPSLIGASLAISDQQFGSTTLKWNGSQWVGSQLSTQITALSDPGNCTGETQGQTLVIYILECNGIDWTLNISYNGCETSSSVYFLIPGISTLPANPNTVSEGGVFTTLSPSTQSCSPINLVFNLPSGNLPKLYSAGSVFTVTA